MWPQHLTEEVTKHLPETGTLFIVAPLTFARAGIMPTRRMQLEEHTLSTGKMSELSRVWRFTVLTPSHSFVFQRDAFSTSCDQWRQTLRARTGEVIFSHSVPESLVCQSWSYAVSNPARFTIEIERVSLLSNSDFSPYSS